MRRVAAFSMICALCAPACQGKRTGELQESPPEHVLSAPEAASPNAAAANTPMAAALASVQQHWLATAAHADAANAAGADPDADPATDSATDSAIDSDRPPYEPCPVDDLDRTDPERLLDHAAQTYDARRFAASLDCASMAVDLAPRSVEGHHMRAAAAAALGDLETAQLAFTLALAVDPDDPQTLAVASDFFINVSPRRARESLMIGLEYARRGVQQVNLRGDSSPHMRARLLLLEAQALNDLGRAREALVRIEQSLAARPRWAEAEHERGVAEFNLCRFERAREAFNKVVEKAPRDAYAHFHLGLIDERLGRKARSEDHFRRARDLAPDDFWAPIAVSRAEFRGEVDKAITELPDDLRRMIDQVSVEVADVPSIDDLMAVEPPFSPTILGLFRGLPLATDPAVYALFVDEPAPARTIVLYRNNLARIAKTRAELDAQIRRTLLHELGHLSGLDEDELRHRGLE